LKGKAVTDYTPSPPDKQIPEPRDLAVENALLRSSLWLTARTLKDYQDAPHFEIDDDGRPMVEADHPSRRRERSYLDKHKVAARWNAILEAAAAI
jgi:hypothetical protein